MKESCKIVAHPKPDGSYTVAILLNNVYPRKLRNGRLYEFVSHQSETPLVFNVNGVPIKPRVLIKIWKKLSRDQASTVENNHITRLLDIPIRGIL